MDVKSSVQLKDTVFILQQSFPTITYWRFFPEQKQPCRLATDQRLIASASLTSGSAARGHRLMTGACIDLNRHLFRNPTTARRIIEARKINDNHNRPHRSLNGPTSAASATRQEQRHAEEGPCRSGLAIRCHSARARQPGAVLAALPNDGDVRPAPPCREPNQAWLQSRGNGPSLPTSGSLGGKGSRSMRASASDDSGLRQMSQCWSGG